MRVQVADSALTGVANGELGLTLTVGGEFDPGNKFYDPLQFTNFVIQLAAKLCVLGQTRVLFADAMHLDSALKDMEQLARMQTQRCGDFAWEG
jgi:hypothetical protein